jgi:hypothetical protein
MYETARERAVWNAPIEHAGGWAIVLVCCLLLVVVVLEDLVFVDDGGAVAFAVAARGRVRVQGQERCRLRSEGRNDAMGFEL